MPVTDCNRHSSAGHMVFDEDHIEGVKEDVILRKYLFFARRACTDDIAVVSNSLMAYR